jgi:hypothetical protein
MPIISLGSRNPKQFQTRPSETSGMAERAKAGVS